MNKVFKFLFYAVSFLFVFVLVFAPLMEFLGMMEMIRDEVPVVALPIGMMGVVAGWLLLTMSLKSTRRWYEKFPFLLPLFQLSFFMTLFMTIAANLLFLWADSESISKGTAIVLAVISLVAGRLFMTIWYTVYPISSKMRRQG